jgi:hypothetical protein
VLIVASQGCDCERIGGIGDIPLLAKEGWTRHQENNAKPPLMERRGGRSQATLRRDDHPVCAASVASRHFLTGAATPPP